MVVKEQELTRRGNVRMNKRNRKRIKALRTNRQMDDMMLISCIHILIQIIIHVYILIFIHTIHM